ncbi:uncharacterized protein LOC122669789 [Telopea speciosissima]|uniref:uncharacterized protein LOC122669789 n=1 Tax=Telopea speciosissima TaxID=54955 RepID=UPI001CC70BCF|nr:uncharacterized protein LOC122669789 [Telopea speciosissima]XP_043722575.1 uncharacterized protein LOC122669789 [Telopea speciosissima]
MEDVITEIPPPSRFFEEDLNNFTAPSPTLPTPFIVFSNPKPNLNSPLRPSLLIIAISTPSINLLHHCLSSKPPIGTLMLPEISLSGNSIEPSLKDKSCHIYALDDQNSIIVVIVQFRVVAERSHAVAKLLIDGEAQICPERVLILDSVQSRNFRSNLPPDEELAFKLETTAALMEEQEGLGAQIRSLGFFLSGSVMDGLGAALLGRCQMRRIKGTLCVTWPESGALALSLVKSLLKDVLPSLEHLRVSDVDDDGSRLDSELYT